MRIPDTWSRSVWARAAAPALPAIENDQRHMTSSATTHHADYVGDGLWVLDYLPGRQFDAQAARTAMLIAIAPDWPEVERWAPRLGLTANEARAFVAGVAK